MSGGPGGRVELWGGSGLVVAGTEWQVERFEPHIGQVLLRRSDGRELATTVRALVNHSDCRPAAATTPSSSHSRGLRPAGLEDLTGRQRELVRMRFTHLMDGATGDRVSSPLHALPRDPQSAYH